MEHDNTKNTPLKPLPPTLWADRLADILKDMEGNPLNVHRLMAHNPDLLQAWWAFRNHSVTGGTLGKRKVELLILRVAVHMKSWYEWAAHVDRALQTGIEMDTIDALLQPLRDGNWPEEEAALLRAVDELTYDHAICESTLAALQNLYSTEQIMDMVAIHGMYLILAAMIRTWNLPLDDEIAQRIAPCTNEEKFGEAARALLTL